MGAGTKGGAFESFPPERSMGDPRYRSEGIRWGEGERSTQSRVRTTDGTEFRSNLQHAPDRSVRVHRDAHRANCFERDMMEECEDLDQELEEEGDVGPIPIQKLEVSRSRSNGRPTGRFLVLLGVGFREECEDTSS